MTEVERLKTIWNRLKEIDSLNIDPAKVRNYNLAAHVESSLSIVEIALSEILLKQELGKS